MYEDTKVSQLVINQLTEEKFKELLDNGELDPNQLYCTDDKAGYTPPLLSTLWSDHLLNDISWLRADTFSWQSGDVYVAAYNHLVDDAFSVTINGEKYYAWHAGILSGIIYYTKSFTPNQGDIVYEESGTGGMIATEYTVTSVAGNELTLSDGSIVSADVMFVFTDTIGDTTITYYRAEDGHKICLPDQENKLLELYNKTGVAWYYILDTENKQFKLPRTKFGFTGLRDSVGNYVKPGIPNLSGHIGSPAYSALGGTDGTLFYDTSVRASIAATSSHSANQVGFDASRVSSVYNDSTTVQPPATQMYLYFYVGNFEQDAVEQTAGITVETLNEKADVDLSNINASQSAKETIVGWGIPDYTAGVSVANNTVISGFTAPEKGILMLGGGAYYPKINGIDLANGSYYTPGDVRFGQSVPIQLDKGDTFSCQSYFVGSGCTNVFYPYKGVN